VEGGGRRVEGWRKRGLTKLDGISAIGKSVKAGQQTTILQIRNLIINFSKNRKPTFSPLSIKYFVSTKKGNFANHANRNSSKVSGRGKIKL
jgi:hypothetical protein